MNFLNRFLIPFLFLALAMPARPETIAISALPSVASPLNASVIPIVNSGTTGKTTVSSLFTGRTLSASTISGGLNLATPGTITVSTGANAITLTASSLGTGSSLIGTQVGGVLGLKGLEAGTNITLSTSATGITISAAGGTGAGSLTPWSSNIDGAGFDLTGAGTVAANYAKFGRSASTAALGINTVEMLNYGRDSTAAVKGRIQFGSTMADQAGEAENTSWRALSLNVGGPDYSSASNVDVAGRSKFTQTMEYEYNGPKRGIVSVSTGATTVITLDGTVDAISSGGFWINDGIAIRGVGTGASGEGAALNKRTHKFTADANAGTSTITIDANTTGMNFTGLVSGAEVYFPQNEWHTTSVGYRGFGMYQFLAGDPSTYPNGYISMNNTVQIALGTNFSRGRRGVPLEISSYNSGDVVSVTLTNSHATAGGTRIKMMSRSQPWYLDTDSGNNGTNDFNIRGGTDPNGIKMIINAAGNIGMGTSAPAARLHLVSTTAQFIAGYNSTAAMTLGVNSVGALTIDTTGDSPQIILPDPVQATSTYASGEPGLTARKSGIIDGTGGTAIISIRSSPSTAASAFSDVMTIGAGYLAGALSNASIFTGSLPIYMSVAGGNNNFQMTSSLFQAPSIYTTDGLIRTDQTTIQTQQPLMLKNYTTGGLPASTTATGMIVANTTTGTPYYSNGTSWTALAAGSAAQVVGEIYANSTTTQTLTTVNTWEQLGGATLATGDMYGGASKVSSRKIDTASDGLYSVVITAGVSSTSGGTFQMTAEHNSTAAAKLVTTFSLPALGAQMVPVTSSGLVRLANGTASTTIIQPYIRSTSAGGNDVVLHSLNMKAVLVAP